MNELRNVKASLVDAVSKGRDISGLIRRTVDRNIVTDASVEFLRRKSDNHGCAAGLLDVVVAHGNTACADFLNMIRTDSGLHAEFPRICTLACRTWGIYPQRSWNLPGGEGLQLINMTLNVTRWGSATIKSTCANSEDNGRVIFENRQDLDLFIPVCYRFMDFLAKERDNVFAVQPGSRTVFCAQSTVVVDINRPNTILLIRVGPAGCSPRNVLDKEKRFPIQLAVHLNDLTVFENILQQTKLTLDTCLSNPSRCMLERHAVRSYEAGCLEVDV